MLKRIFTAVICVTMMLTSGCALKDKLTKKIKSENNIEDVFNEAVSYGNIELIDELIQTGNVTQDMLNSGLYNASLTTGDNYIVMVHLIENGADPNYHDMPQQFAYNGNTIQMTAILTSPDVDINQKSKLGYSVLYQAMENQSGGLEGSTYNIAKMLVDKDVEIDPEIFKNEDTSGEVTYAYRQLIQSPLTTKMLIKKCIDDGKNIDIPEAVRYALCGDIESCIESIPNCELTEGDKKVIACYALYYGNVSQYKELSKFISFENYIVYRDIAMCGNTEMLDYVLKENNAELKADEEKMKEDLSYASQYNKYSDCLSYAAYWGHYNTCKYLCENNVKPIHGNGYEALSNAISSGNFDLVKYIYSYITEYDGRISEENMGQTLMLVGKRKGSCIPLSNYDKQIYDFLLNEEYEFTNFPVDKFDSATNEYLINNGMDLSDENLKLLAQKNDFKSLQAAFEKGYKPDSEVLKTAVLHASSDTVKLILDNGAEMPDDIMEDAKYASKATVKVLIKAGAKTNLKFNELKPADGGGLVQKGDFDLKDYYIHYGREDLAELL